MVDQNFGAPLSEEAAKARRISRSPHANEFLSVRRCIDGASAEEGLHLPGAETLVRDCSIHDAHDRAAAASE
jgi:hypothetical protein